MQEALQPGILGNVGVGAVQFPGFCEPQDLVIEGELIGDNDWEGPTCTGTLSGRVLDYRSESEE
jgi:hypothetical protein